MPELFQQVAKWAESLTLLGVLAIVIVAGYKRIWVWGWQFDAQQKELDFWRDAALRGTYMTERTVQVAETAVGKVLKP